MVEMLVLEVLNLSDVAMDGNVVNVFYYFQIFHRDTRYKEFEI